jgi:bicarbonate transport system ATP-binding protein
VLGVREDWANAYPNTHIALVKALLEASHYCANPANELEVRKIVAQREYVNTDIGYIHLGNPDQAYCSLDQPMREFAHHLFFGDGVNRPSRTEHLWHMTQLARWGHTPFPRNWVEIMERVCRVSVFSTAARELGLLDVKYTSGAIAMFDGTTFTADDPIGYLNRLKIKRDFSIAEVVLDSRPLSAA